MNNLLTLLAFFVPVLLWAQPTNVQNVTDDFGKKQGFWVHKGNEALERFYCDTCRYKEGFYSDDLKVGVWTKYYTNSTAKQSEITFDNDLPNGPYTLYYQDGKIQEKGTLLNGKNVGEMIKFWTNDSVKQRKTFDENGVLHGYVMEFFPNGQLKLKYKRNKGVRVDTLVEYGSMNQTIHTVYYDSLGDIISQTRSYPKGIPTTTFINKRPGLERELPDSLSNCEVSIVRSGKLFVEGTFSGRMLNTGRYYVYDHNGILTGIQFWANGHFVRDEYID